MDFIFYLTLFLFILLFGTLDNGIDYDFWARLIVGKSYFQTGNLFNNDFYSYGTTHSFIDHEWGSSLIFYLIQDNFNDIGLYIFKSIIIFLTLFIITKTIKLNKNDTKLNFLFFFFAIQSVSYSIFATIRCQTFSFLFFAIYIYLAQRIRINKEYRLLWLFPILNIIWANLHGGFVIGLAILMICAIGEFLNNKASKKYLYFLATFLITSLTTLINPYGISYLSFIFDAFMLNRVHITEWQSAFFNKNYVFMLLKFKAFFTITILIFLFSIIKNIKNSSILDFYKKIDKTKYLILLFMILISLKALRCHVFFTYCVIIFCYSDFYNIFNKQLPEKIDKIKEYILLILILISTISHIINFRFINTTKNSQYPIYAVEFIKQNNIKGNVFVNFHLGSYVIYKLYPNNHVFMDGRYEEIYDNNLINKMAKFFLGKSKDEFLQEFHNDILIIDNSYPIKKILDNDKKWFMAWEDEFYTLYLDKKLKKDSYIHPSKDINYYNKTKFKTSIDWLK
ncbi:hypothetical protein IJ425_04480 [bacterium]|nr:hypothetical protein [bacterium]